MRIALDFDGTYTADPELWQLFVKKALKNGHDVRIVTARYEIRPEDLGGNQDVYDACLEMGIPAIFCNLQQKQDCWGADIWIDDRPDMVIGTAQLNHMYAELNAD